ncbi:MAG: MFS transporter [Betaproteobacteria bacterium]|nr:MAG: MFS transporter [Betaproteobacteria bacterium]
MRLFYGWVIVAVAFVTMAIGVNARTAFSLLFPPIVDEFGWDRGATAAAFSFGFILAALLSPFLGRWMDRFGPRPVLEAGVVCVAIGLVAAAHISAPWQLHATLGLLVGAGSVCLSYTGQSCYLPNWFVRRRGLAMSVAFSGVGVGSIVLFPPLQALIAAAGWRTACTAFGIVVLVVLAPLNLLVRRRPGDLGLHPDGDAAAPHVIAPSAPSGGDWTLAAALRSARFWWLALAYASGLYAWYAVQVHQTRYLLEVGFSGAEAALALGVVSLAGIPGQIALGHLSDRIAREWVWCIGQLGFVVCYGALLALAHAPVPALLWLMVLAQGFLGYGVTSVVGAIPAEAFQGRHYGGIFGTLMGLGIAGGAIGPWVTGLAYDLSASYAPGFALALGCCVLSGAAIWMGRESRASVAHATVK